MHGVAEGDNISLIEAFLFGAVEEFYFSYVGHASCAERGTMVLPVFADAPLPLDVYVWGRRKTEEETLTGLDIRFNGRDGVKWQDCVDFGGHDIFLEAGSGVPFSQHHIVPWNTLESFWGHLVKNSLFGQCARIITAYAERVPHHPIDIPPERCAALKEFADAIKGCTFKEGAGIAEIGEKCQRNFSSMFNDAHALYSYPAVDVFPGPSGDKRVDDAKDGFEEVAVHVVADKDDWSRLRKVHTFLNLANAEAVKALSGRRAINRKVMNTGVRSLVSLLNHNSPDYCRFRKDKWDWIKHENGQNSVVTDRTKWNRLAEPERRYRVHPRGARARRGARPSVQ